MRKLLLALALLVCVPQLAFAQRILTTPTFLEDRLLPRAHALGDATVALRGYSGAVQVNPATIGQDGSVQAMSYVFGGDSPLYATPWPLTNTLTSLEADELWIAEPSVSYKHGQWAGAYQYRRFNFGMFETRDNLGEVCGTLTAYDASHHVAVAYDVSESLSLGGGAEYIRSDPGVSDCRGGIDINPATSLALNLGVHYEHPPLALAGFRVTPSAGWALRHFGGKMSFVEDSLAGGGDPLPITTQAGVSVQARTSLEALDRPLVRIGLSGNLSKLLAGRPDPTTTEDGATSYSEPYGPFEALYKTWGAYRVDFDSTDDDPGERVGAWEGIDKHGGVELALLDIFALRLGKVWRHREGVGSQTTAGFGLDLYYVALDHSAVWGAENDLWSEASLWTLTARVPLGEAAQAQNFWPELIGATTD